MISGKSLLNMILIEAITGEGIIDREGKPVVPENNREDSLPPRRYNLELIQVPRSDGSKGYEWREDES
jgi:hypothetical protein